MKSLIESPPRTIMEVYKKLPEGTLAELIDNVIYMAGSPFFKHQIVLQSVFKQLDKNVADKQLGVVIVAPFNVFLDEVSNAVQPDIIVVLKPNENIIDPEGHIHGVPDLLMEVLSEGNKSHDMILKKDLYERFGVKEYWIIDPQTKLALGFSLKSNKYVSIGEWIAEIDSPLLNCRFNF